jgi:hypothetical protein
MVMRRRDRRRWAGVGSAPVEEAAVTAAGVSAGAGSGPVPGGRYSTSFPFGVFPEMVGIPACPRASSERNATGSRPVWSMPKPSARFTASGA